MSVEKISIVFSCISLIIAGGALLLSLRVYFKYDKRIKKNQLSQISQEKRPKIRIEVIKSSPQGKTNYNGFKFYLATKFGDDINLEYNKTSRIFKSDSAFSVKVKTKPKTIVGLCIVSMDWYDPYLKTTYNEIDTVVLE